MTNETNQPVASPQQLQLAMRDMRDRVRAWWKREGLGHTSEVRLSESGHLEIEFSCSPYSEIEERMYEEDPSLSDAERRARAQRHFEERGFVLFAEPGNDVNVRDCDASCQTLRQLIAQAFPSSFVRSMDTRGTRSGVFVLQSMHVIIRDLAEVFALPAPPPDA
jgi:hypothetical protein